MPSHPFNSNTHKNKLKHPHREPLKISAIILAAGSGLRAGHKDKPKQYQKIGGVPLLKRTVEAFLMHPAIYPILIAIRPGDEELCRNALGKYASKVTIVHGGNSRQSSTLKALEALVSFHPDYVHIHDGARPFIEQHSLNLLHSFMAQECGVILALPVTDSLKKVDETDNIIEDVARTQLYRAQTPQFFPFQKILQAHQAAADQGKGDFTDDACVATWYGLPVKIAQGSETNRKITLPEDFVLADIYLKRKAMPDSSFPDVRTGNGYDVHRFENGTEVILCGVKIPFHKKLQGHSDADVGFHALTDALLATCGAGDIGTHFPPEEQAWKNASSSIFLEHAAKCIKEKGGHINHVDITFIAEAPYIKKYRQDMVKNIQNALGLDQERISIKATTNEKMGFIGRQEGIAAIATATVIYSKK